MQPHKTPLSKLPHPALDDSRSDQLLESPHDMMISEESSDVQARWKAFEYETYERDRKWFLTAAFILIAIISYAIYTNSPIMAITFILILVVGYVYVTREPRLLDFRITPEGVIAGKELYEFDNIHSFWIFYEPGEIKAVSLRMKKSLIPHVHIPVGDEDPSKIRAALVKYIPEEKQEVSFVEIVSRVFRI